MGQSSSSYNCQTVSPTASSVSKMSSLVEPDTKVEIATVGMGCFWGVESLYGATPGVLRTRVGFTGGKKVGPTYQDLYDHTEGTEIEYDPNVITYEGIMDLFWTKHDPTEKHKTQYMSVIFCHDDAQKAIAEKTMSEAQKKTQKPIVTKIVSASEFYNAEFYHQKYRFQGHKSLVKMIEKAGMKDLIKSHVACRLNGYLGGDGTLEQFRGETLGLPEEAVKYMEKVLAAGINVSCH